MDGADERVASVDWSIKLTKRLLLRQARGDPGVQRSELEARLRSLLVRWKYDVDAEVLLEILGAWLRQVRDARRAAARRGLRQWRAASSSAGAEAERSARARSLAARRHGLEGGGRAVGGRPAPDPRRVRTRAALARWRSGANRAAVCGWLAKRRTRAGAPVRMRRQTFFRRGQ